MSYKVELSENFKKEAKKLTKKFPSLKQELVTLFSQLETNPTMDCHLATTFIKYDSPLLQKIKAKVAEQEFFLL